MRKSLGFTLIEVLVALTVSSVVVVLAHRLFSAMVDGTRRAAEARMALDREMNARRWLKSAFLSLEAGTAESGGFEGRSTFARFGAWQLVPGGWFEVRRVTIARNGSHVVGGDVVLADSVRLLEFDYLLEPGAQATWVREWISPVSAPVAVRMRIQREPARTDTMLFLVRERG
jgi:prepilin-type N-terminal cleavage/methylation domain-containing protein